MTRAHETPPVKTISLSDIVADYGRSAGRIVRRIIICAGTGCVANGSLQVHRVLQEKLRAVGLDAITTLELNDERSHDVHLSRSGCQGFCQMGPLVTIEPDGILYTRVQPGDVDDIVEMTLQQGELVERLLYVEPGRGRPHRGHDDIPF